MPRAKVAITLPEDVWIARLSQTYPDAEFRVLGVLRTDEGGTGLLEVSASAPEAVVEAMDGLAGIEAVEPLAASGDRVHVQFRTREPLLLLSAESAGVPIQPPIAIADGVATVWTAGSGDQLSTFADRLEAQGLTLEIEAVTTDVDSGRLLTDRQREVLLAAVERGYYETPRACSLTALAADLDLAPSTVSETLHRAEGRVITAFVDAMPTDRPRDAWPPS